MVTCKQSCNVLWCNILPCISVETGSGHPGHVLSGLSRPEIIRVWPGLDHVSREIKKAWYGSRMMASTATFASWAMPTFRNNDFTCCKCTGSPPFISFVHMHATIAIYSLLRAMPITVAGALPLQYVNGIFTCSRLIACMKPLTPIQATFLCL